MATLDELMLEISADGYTSKDGFCLPVHMVQRTNRKVIMAIDNAELEQQGIRGIVLGQWTDETDHTGHPTIIYQIALVIIDYEIKFIKIRKKIKESPDGAGIEVNQTDTEVITKGFAISEINRNGIGYLDVVSWMEEQLLQGIRNELNRHQKALSDIADLMQTAQEFQASENQEPE